MPHHSLFNSSPLASLYQHRSANTFGNATRASRSSTNASRSFTNASRGFTLVEILLVLGIIAVLAIAAFIIYPKVQASSQARTIASNITTLKAGANTLFATTGRYVSNGSTLDATAFGDLMAKAKAIPTNMLDPAANTMHSVVDPTPNSVLIQTSTAYGSADGLTPAGPYLFDLTYSKVPTDVCNKLATNVGATFENLFIGGVSVFTATAPFQIDPGLVATQCATATRVDMDFISR